MIKSDNIIYYNYNYKSITTVPRERHDKLRCKENELMVTSLLTIGFEVRQLSYFLQSFGPKIQMNSLELFLMKNRYTLSLNFYSRSLSFQQIETVLSWLLKVIIRSVTHCCFIISDAGDFRISADCCYNPDHLNAKFSCCCSQFQLVLQVAIHSCVSRS